MKKIILFFITIAFLSGPVLVRARIIDNINTEDLNINTEQLEDKKDEIKTQVDTISEENYDEIKADLLKFIDDRVIKLDESINNVNSSNLTQESKEVLTADLERVKSQLIEYRAAVNQAESLEELRAVNKEVRDYVKENKDVIKENSKNTIKALSIEALRVANQFLELAEDILWAVDNICGADDSTINQLQTDIDDLQTSISSLEQAINNEDTATMKTEMINIAILSVKIYNQVYALEGTCY